MSFEDIDLQWFAAEDEGRTEEPSDLKLEKARKEVIGAHLGVLFSFIDKNSHFCYNSINVRQSYEFQFD